MGGQPNHIVVRSPFDGRRLGEVARMSEIDVHREIGIAHEALRAEHPLSERAAVLDRAVVLLQERADAFATSICDEAGKPISLARAEVDRACDTLRASAIEARTLVGEVVPMAGTSVGAATVGWTLRVPVGVVAAITPFNFPLNLVCHKLGPAIAAGCPIVHKPASSTPLTSVMLHELLHEAGLPSDRLRLVLGDGSVVGDALVVDPRIRHVSFTGSSEVGWALPKRVHHARVALELGNSTPLVVFADADLDAVAAAVANNGYGFAGQSCISIQRLLLDERIANDALELVEAALEAIGVGDPSLPDVVCGPVINTRARDATLAMMQQARDAGATLRHGGDFDRNVIEPMLMTNVDPGLPIVRNELFGPGVVAMTFSSEAEAYALANDTPYGLQAGVFTSDISRATRSAAALEFGGVTINVSPTFRADQMPYGGVKESGNTKEGPAWAVRELTHERLVVLGRE